MTFPNRRVELLQALTDGVQLEYAYTYPDMRDTEVELYWSDVKVTDDRNAYNQTAIEYILGVPLPEGCENCAVIVRIKGAV